MTRRLSVPRRTALGVALSLVTVAAVLGAPQTRQTTDVVAVDKDDIGGVVTGPNGPEAGVWVIAETAARSSFASS